MAALFSQAPPDCAGSGKRKVQAAPKPGRMTTAQRRVDLTVPDPISIDLRDRVTPGVEPLGYPLDGEGGQILGKDPSQGILQPLRREGSLDRHVGDLRLGVNSGVRPTGSAHPNPLTRDPRDSRLEGALDGSRGLPFRLDLPAAE